MISLTVDIYLCTLKIIINSLYLSVIPQSKFFRIVMRKEWHLLIVSN